MLTLTINNRSKIKTLTPFILNTLFPSSPKHLINKEKSNLKNTYEKLIRVSKIVVLPQQIVGKIKIFSQKVFCESRLK